MLNVTREYLLALGSPGKKVILTILNFEFMTSIIIDSPDDKELNARLRLMLRNFRQNEGLRQAFSNRFPAELTYHSTAIEGSTLTLDEVRAVVGTNQRIPGKPDLHWLMVKDYYEALLFVGQSVRHDHRLTVDFICEIASRVMHSTGSLHKTILGEFDEAKGQLRLHNVQADGQYFLGYDKVVSALHEYVLKTESLLKEVSAEKDHHPTSILKVFWKAHYDFLSIHPFGDGNGRTARLIMDYLFARVGFPPCIVHVEDRELYISSLRKAHQTGDYKSLTSFMNNQYLKSLAFYSS